ncbi:MAG: hypothetical protein ABFD46_03845 [Armatimonadota bacterium]
MDTRTREELIAENEHLKERLAVLEAEVEIFGMTSTPWDYRTTG